MKTIIYNTLILLSAFGLWSSCERDILIEQLPYDSKPSIQCLLTPGELPVLYLQRTLPFFNPISSKRDLFIDSATVRISSAEGTDILMPDSLLDPFFCHWNYFYKGRIPVESNVDYHLEIIWGGETYTATTSTDEVIVEIDSIGYTDSFRDIYGEHEGVIFNFKDHAQEGNFYRYEMHRLLDSTTYAPGDVKSPCLGNEKVAVTEIGRTLYKDENINGGDMSFTIEPAFKHAEGDSVFYFIQSCDLATYEFYDQLDKQKLALKNPFVEPVFLKPTQFPNAIGVFGSFVRSDSVLFIYTE